MIERVLSGETLSPGRCQEGTVAANEGERMTRNDLTSTQRNGKLHRIIGFERMTLGEVCGGDKIFSGQGDNGITMRQMAGEALIFAPALCAPDPADPLNDR